jgi:hypothetical protein
MSPRSHLINTCEHIRPRGKSRGVRKKELSEYLLWQAELLAEGLWQWHGFTSVDQSVTRTGSGTGWRST